MNEQIVKDLKKHFDQKLKLLMVDFMERCQTVDIPDDRILGELSESTLGFASRVIARTSSISPEAAGEMFKEVITKERNTQQQETA